MSEQRKEGAGDAVKVNAQAVASPFREKIRTRVLELKEQGIEAPLLVGILANKDPGAVKYAEWTGKICALCCS
jgi:methylenetetrahydrofolate dehydrogenase (NAD+)